MSFEDMVKQFKTDVELRAYSEAQYSTIIQLSKDIQKKDEEIKHLKALLESSTPLLEEQKKDFLGYNNLEISNEELICTVQLQKMKVLALDRPLTLEETRKTEIFSNILLRLKGKENKKEGEETKNLSTAELLKLVSVSDNVN